MRIMKRILKSFKCSNVIILFFIMFLPTDSSEVQYKTKAASEKHHDLWCYKCDTMIDGENCLDLHGNFSNMNMKCNKEQKKCQVRRISISTSTEEITGKPKLWLLQRDCSETCEPGCIVIGERTKLHSCITCCDEPNFCNADNSAYTPQISSTFISFMKIFSILKSSIDLINYIV